MDWRAAGLGRRDECARIHWSDRSNAKVSTPTSGALVPQPQPALETFCRELPGRAPLDELWRHRPETRKCSVLPAVEDRGHRKEGSKDWKQRSPTIISLPTLCRRFGWCLGYYSSGLIPQFPSPASSACAAITTNPSSPSSRPRIFDAHRSGGGILIRQCDCMFRTRPRRRYRLPSPASKCVRCAAAATYSVLFPQPRPEPPSPDLVPLHHASHRSSITTTAAAHPLNHPQLARS